MNYSHARGDLRLSRVGDGRPQRNRVPLISVESPGERSLEVLGFPEVSIVSNAPLGLFPDILYRVEVR